MNNKEMENLIIDKLNSQKPDRSVLSSAKSVMAKNKPIRLRIKRQFYALISCAAAFILIGAIMMSVIFSIYNQPDDKGYENSSLNNVNKNVSGFENSFIIAAIILISLGILLAIVAIITRIKKTNKNK